ncbi:hypothetical protein M3Y98_00032600 [Aphelenchoides besseyi]|nr:hypothetical protein M3Y98_00032600 [Aphelenchoides besseyi]
MHMLTVMLLCQFILISVFIGPAVSLSCYQQPYVPGQQNYLGYSQNKDNLPKMQCSGAQQSCFKFVCFGTTYYTVRGCLSYDPAQPQQNCQILQGQCPGNQGTCYTCNGNNCNGAPSLRSGSIGLIGLLLGGATIFMFNKQ